MADKVFLVTNRSASRVHYSLPELGIKSRDFQPGETKRLKYSELEALSYIPGGLELIRGYLQVQPGEARNDIVGRVEPEYNMTEKEVRELIQTGSLDEWLDCLDFAPEGVLDLVKALSVEIPLTDTRKMDAYKKKTGTDLARMIRAKQEEEAEAAALAAQEERNTPRRRVTQQVESEPEQTPGRRTSGSKYKVVSKATPTA